MTAVLAAASMRTGAQNYRQRGISPIFDGWETLPDGSRLFYFGYINRNGSESNIPIGPANGFEPGAADRGQPTSFLPGRQEHVFTIKAAADFKGKLVWTVQSEMGLQTATATFNQLYILEERENENPNARPPVVKLADTSARAGQDVVIPAAITPAITGGQVVVEGAAAEAAGLNVAWTKYRGTGGVTFSAAPGATAARGAAGRGTAARGGRGGEAGGAPGASLTVPCGAKPAAGCGGVTARFDQAGVYMLRVAARQDGMQGLGFVRVTVNP